MQSAELIFRRWMRILISLFVLTVIYIVIADRYAPLTTESRVHSRVLQVAPEITGTVLKVYVSNNQKVLKGDLLFTIEPHKFTLAVESAEVAFTQSKEQEKVLRANMKAMFAKVKAEQIKSDNANHEYNRVYKLSLKKAVSPSMLERASTTKEELQSNLIMARQGLVAIESQLSEVIGESSLVQAAENRLRLAKLNLSHAQVFAPNDGVVTNMRLSKGTAARASAPLITIIPTGTMWVASDFREKSVALINDNSAALVAFDALPGKIYSFNIHSRDFGVAAAQQNPNGKLTSIEINNRWVRNAQRIRVNLVSKNTLPEQLFVGSRASVVIYPENSAFWSLIAKAQINIVSLFHYIY